MQNINVGLKNSKKRGPVLIRIMNCCTYDNPATMARECWQDGKLICKYDSTLFFLPNPIPAEHYFFGANIGPWNEGQLVGNKKGLEQDAQTL